MVVKPPQQQLLCRHGREILESFVVLEQTNQLGVLFQVNLCKQLDLHELPNHPQNKTGLVCAFAKISCSNVCDLGSNRLCCLHNQVVILVHLKKAEALLPFSLVNSAHIDSIRSRGIDELCKEDAD